MDELHAQVLRGLRLFNQRDFYECHDTLEEVWLQESSDRQPFLQGLIQAAVAFHHFGHGKYGAARSMLRLALEKLSAYPEQTEGLELGELRRELQQWKTFLDDAIRNPPAQAAPEFPRIRFRAPD